MKRKKQLYFNVVLIYTNNKVKLKEGKRRNGFAIIFFLPETYFNTFSLFEVIHYLENYPYVKKEYFRGSILLILAE